MRILLPAITACIAVTGCATPSKQLIAPAATTAMQGQTIAQTKRPVPSFAAMTPGKAMFAAIGGAMMIAAGNSLIEKNKVDDPADLIASDLVATLASAHGVKPAGSAIAIDTGDVGQIANAAGSATRYVVDVQTFDWRLGYFASDWGRYRVNYAAKARLIDVSARSVVAEGFCQKIPEWSADAPSYDALTTNDATLLKQTLRASAEACAKTFKSEMFGL